LACDGLLRGKSDRKNCGSSEEGDESGELHDLFFLRLEGDIYCACAARSVSNYFRRGRLNC
jgi:hypothetical protein